MTPVEPLTPRSRIEDAMRRHIRAQHTLDEAIFLVVLRSRLPRGLKWLVGFPRTLKLYGRLRGWR